MDEDELYFDCLYIAISTLLTKIIKIDNVKIRLKKNFVSFL